MAEVVVVVEAVAEVVVVAEVVAGAAAEVVGYCSMTMMIHGKEICMAYCIF